MIGILFAGGLALISQPGATGGSHSASDTHATVHCQTAANVEHGSAHPSEATAPTPATGGESTAQAKHSGKVSRYHPDRFAGRAGSYYRLVWGVDSPAVKWAESGEVIRFTYRVLDAERAKSLNDGKNEPSLIDPRAGVRLVVPAMENVGQLRQTAAPENSKSYWILFSNKGRLVKRGDHVNVVIGAFHADGLVVD